MNSKLGGSLGDQSQFTTWVEGGEGFLGGVPSFSRGSEGKISLLFRGDCRKLTVKWGGGGGEALEYCKALCRIR